MATRRLWSGVAGILVLVARPCTAQERVLPDPEAVRPPAPAQAKVLPAPEQPPPPADMPPLAEDCEKPCPTTFRWVLRQVPIQVLVPREVITQERRKTLEVAYREEKQTVTELILKPREVKREEVCTMLKPVTVTDPHTGQCSTVMQPVPETRVIRDTVYEPTPVKRVLVVRVPYLRPAEEIVPQRTVLLEYRTELKVEGYPVQVPGGEVLKDRWFLVPKPPCEGEETVSPPPEPVPPRERPPEPVPPPRERPPEPVPPPRPENP